MRALIMQYLVGDPAYTALTDLIPAERWYSGRSVVDAPPRPFAVLRFGGVFAGMGPVKGVRLEIWVHDEPGSYDLVDDVIIKIRERLDGVAHLQDATSQLILATWASDSTDLFDPGYQTNTRSTGYDLVGKGV